MFEDDIKNKILDKYIIDNPELLLIKIKNSKYIDHKSILKQQEDELLSM